MRRIDACDDAKVGPLEARARRLAPLDELSELSKALGQRATANGAAMMDALSEFQTAGFEVTKLLLQFV